MDDQIAQPSQLVVVTTFEIRRIPIRVKRSFTRRIPSEQESPPISLGSFAGIERRVIQGSLSGISQGPFNDLLMRYIVA
jgi:hypothetical protein